MHFGYSQSDRLVQGRWTCDKTARPYETVATAALNHVRQVNDIRFFDLLDVLDMSPLSITTLHGLLKESTTLDAAVISLGVPHHQTKELSNGGIFGWDSKLEYFGSVN